MDGGGTGTGSGTKSGRLNEGICCPAGDERLSSGLGRVFPRALLLEVLATGRQSGDERRRERRTYPARRLRTVRGRTNPRHEPPLASNAPLEQLRRELEENDPGCVERSVKREQASEAEGAASGDASPRRKGGDEAEPGRRTAHGQGGACGRGGRQARGGRARSGGGARRGKGFQLLRGTQLASRGFLVWSDVSANVRQREREEGASAPRGTLSRAPTLGPPSAPPARCALTAPQNKTWCVRMRSC